jgi:hypothetical protein
MPTRPIGSGRLSVAAVGCGVLVVLDLVLALFIYEIWSIWAGDSNHGNGTRLMIGLLALLALADAVAAAVVCAGAVAGLRRPGGVGPARLGARIAWMAPLVVLAADLVIVLWFRSAAVLTMFMIVLIGLALSSTWQIVAAVTVRNALINRAEQHPF